MAGVTYGLISRNRVHTVYVWGGTVFAMFLVDSSSQFTVTKQHLEQTKLAQVSRPQRPRGTMSRSRRILSAVRRAFWMRDNGQCAFIGRRGRCTERGFLEFHHVVPFADGGAAVAENIELRYRAHNQYESERWFGTQDPLVVRERARYVAPQPLWRYAASLAGSAAIGRSAYH